MLGVTNFSIVLPTKFLKESVTRLLNFFNFRNGYVGFWSQFSTAAAKTFLE